MLRSSLFALAACAGLLTGTGCSHADSPAVHHLTVRQLAARPPDALPPAPLAVPVALALGSPWTRYAEKIGVDLDPPNEGSRTRAWVDLGRGFRPFEKIGGGSPAPTDTRGYPVTDARTVFFDIRPFPAWNPPIDDPQAFQPDFSGTYHLSFRGQATITPNENKQIVVTHQVFSAATDTTTADIIVPKGAGLLALAFTGTKRLPGDAPGTGLTDLHLIRPGYAPGTKQLYTNEFLASLRPFRVLRFMDWLATNDNPGFYGDPGHHALHWADRHVPSDATQQDVGDKHGVAWEYAVALANGAGKDMWINVPVAADDDYVRQLALLLKRTLRPSLRIYIEHSNEVWNFGFPQYIYNKLAAEDEVKASGSPLNNDGSTDHEVWAHRRHAKRLVEIAKIFGSVYGPRSIGAAIRPIYASWVINPNDYYADVLKWVSSTYGPPKSYFYGVAGAAYFNVQKAAPNASVTDLLTAMWADSDNNLQYRTAIGKIASSYGLKNTQYEVGPDTGGGSTVNVANRILANHDPRIKEIILHDARDNWFACGGDLYMYFAFCSSYSRYGGWGLSEDVADLNTPKWQAIYTLTGVMPPHK